MRGEDREMSKREDRRTENRELGVGSGGGKKESLDSTGRLKRSLAMGAGLRMRRLGRWRVATL